MVSHDKREIVYDFVVSGFERETFEKLVQISIASEFDREIRLGGNYVVREIS